MSKKILIVSFLAVIIIVGFFIYRQITEEEEEVVVPEPREFGEGPNTEVLGNLYDLYKDELNYTRPKENFNHGNDAKEMTYIAIIEDDVNRCNLLVTENKREVCLKLFYFVKALKEKNVEQCYNIIDEDRQKVCLSMFDKASCRSIENETEQILCEVYVKNKEDMFNANFPCDEFEQEIPGFSKKVCEWFKKAALSS